MTEILKIFLSLRFHFNNPHHFSFSKSAVSLSLQAGKHFHIKSVAIKVGLHNSCLPRGGVMKVTVEVGLYNSCLPW